MDLDSSGVKLHETHGVMYERGYFINKLKKNVQYFIETSEKYSHLELFS